MKIALIIPDGFKNLDYLSTLLNEITCDEIISGSYDR